ncbi:MAG: Beta-xylosidase, partial [Microgenomates group bacterium GW2011_GWB1_46_7]
MQSFWQKNWKSLVILGGLLASLPLTVPLAQKAWKVMTGASYQAAAIVVDVSQAGAPVNRIWDGVAQGFEKLPDQDFRLSPVAGLLKGVNVRYVRIDHVYDGYDVVSRADGGLMYDWSKLDALVGDILSAGAIPFFSISYMPSAISKSDILDEPTDWGEWGAVVSALVGHYSRDYRGGLSNV